MDIDGTHVAGTIADIGGNDISIVGVLDNGTVHLYIARAIHDSES